MVRRTVCLVAGMVLLSGLSYGQESGGKPPATGLALCVGIDRYPLLGDLKGSRERAETIGKKLKDVGYQFVTVLVDGAKRWEDRATLANIRNHALQFARLARPEDRLVVFFAGRGIMVKGQACLVPAHGDEDNTVPVEWLLKTLAESKAGSKFLVVDAGKGVSDIAAALEKAEADKRVTVMPSGDLPAAALKVTKREKPKPGHGRISLVMHRTVVMRVRGRTRESWRFNEVPLAYTFPFDLDTHAVVGTVELPAGDYKITMTKWEHWEDRWGHFEGGPYDSHPIAVTVKAGADHEIRLHNVQFPLSPHGTGTFYWDGRRICRTNSLTKEVVLDADLDRELAKGTRERNVRATVSAANAQRGAKLYAMAAKGYVKALRQSREIGNRVLIAEAARETAWLLATARDEALRNAGKALLLAEEALQLAKETEAPNLWYYKDALAAALAENGNFKDAEKQMTEVIAEANQQDTRPLPHIMKGLEERLKLYQSGKPYRE
ncbi:MAG: hypothetical protein AMK75_04865 [Planctomycetes bacterium SM23_65]|nr:MAG: hypothetical protein AMK75_04865 [Planctomycetes bacterium SM23_65]